ncbi:MAG TPA: HlyD family efflux transporter periplasmic adaptor subunit, partial [Armatimonadota bacterium]|nr:HlyD family efflux transporter periplasmic adaptor subunit [Armatimonadota bacterium]
AQIAAAEEERSAAAAALAQARSEHDAEIGNLERQISDLQKRQSQPVTYTPEGVTLEPAAWVEEPGPAEEQDSPGQIQALQAQIRERESVWAPVFSAASARIARAERELHRLRAAARQAERRSPASGVVTAVYVKPGDTVQAGQPVVRVDNPSGYRVVTLLDKKAAAGLRPGSSIRLASGGEGQVQKLVPGWDRELFRTWVWVKPEEGRALRPGENVQVLVPTRTFVARN